MSSGELRCPKCQTPGMGGYLYYDSKSLNEKHYIFYNTEAELKKWKCWALLGLCGREPIHWYDPCGQCFNPCNFIPDVVTKIDGVEVSRRKDEACGICCCICFLLICYLIYAMYATIFVWYDIYYYFCKERTIKKIICLGNSKETVSMDYWPNVGPNLYTENYWCNNFPNLFRCNNCNYCAKTFRDFMGNDQIYAVDISSSDMNNNQ